MASPNEQIQFESFSINQSIDFKMMRAVHCTCFWLSKHTPTIDWLMRINGTTITILLQSESDTVSHLKWENLHPTFTLGHALRSHTVSHSSSMRESIYLSCAFYCAMNKHTRHACRQLEAWRKLSVMPYYWHRIAWFIGFQRKSVIYSPNDNLLILTFSAYPCSQYPIPFHLLLAPVWYWTYE